MEQQKINIDDLKLLSIKDILKMEIPKYRFQLAMNQHEKHKFEKVCFHNNTTKTLLLRKHINDLYDVLVKDGKVRDLG